jgi:hypothetical protein
MTSVPADRTTPPALPREQAMALMSAVMLPMFLAVVDQTLLATATPRIRAGVRQSRRQLLDRDRLPDRCDGDGAGLRTPRRPGGPAQHAALGPRRVRGGCGMHARAPGGLLPASRRRTTTAKVRRLGRGYSREHCAVRPLDCEVMWESERSRRSRGSAPGQGTKPLSR